MEAIVTTAYKYDVYMRRLYNSSLNYLCRHDNIHVSPYLVTR